MPFWRSLGVISDIDLHENRIFSRPRFWRQIWVEKGSPQKQKKEQEIQPDSEQQICPGVVRGGPGVAASALPWYFEKVVFSLGRCATFPQADFGGSLEDIESFYILRACGSICKQIKPQPNRITQRRWQQSCRRITLTFTLTSTCTHTLSFTLTLALTLAFTLTLTLALTYFCP